MSDPIVSEELALLDRVLKGLAKAPAHEPPSERSIVEELERVREQLLRSQLDYFERSALNTRWTELSALLKQLRESRRMPRVDSRSPYFAHLRLREDGRERDLCLGKATCLEHGLRIVDWRHAPIAKLFYRYRQGEDYEEQIGNRTMIGEVMARRTVAIRDGVLERIDAPEGSFVVDPETGAGWRRASVEAPRLAGGEGAALRIHEEDGAQRRLGTDVSGQAHRADKRLPDIAGLIDPEQFRLITKPSSGFVAIRGGAGSGKTTVALHRIAYLAYDDARMDSDQVLFLVFSRALRDYVAHVLPALGVTRVQVRTFQEWAAEQRRRLFPRLPASHRENTPAPVQRLKLHPVFETALERQVARVPGRGTAAQAIDDWLSVSTGRELLEEVIAETAPEAFSPRQLDAALRWCRERGEELRAWLAGDESAEAELDPEDDALLLRAWQLRVGPLPGGGERPLRYRHVAIDEVQDFSPTEVRVLLDCLDPHRSLTLAGDTQQQMLQDASFGSWDEFFGHLGLPGTSVSTLQVSYRSSREITEFALALLGDEREDDTPLYTTRSGPPVELFRFTDAGACVAFLAESLIRLGEEEPLASVAVLTPSREVSDLYHAGLEAGDVPRLHRVRNQDFRFSPGIEITEIEQVKGLEFDYVILAEATERHFSDDPASRRRLHVGVTRAVHQCWLVCVGTPASVVTAANEAR